MELNNLIDIIRYYEQKYNNIIKLVQEKNKLNKILFNKTSPTDMVSLYKKVKSYNEKKKEFEELEEKVRKIIDNYYLNNSDENIKNYIKNVKKLLLLNKEIIINLEKSDNNQSEITFINQELIFKKNKISKYIEEFLKTLPETNICKKN